MSNDKTVAASWPVVAGSYQVGDPKAPVAVCALTSERLVGPLAGLPGVAIAGIVYTANLGIERIILNITTNPMIRFLLVCGRESALFKPGQSLVALAEQGVDGEKRIVGAAGYEPVLPNLPPEQIGQFRKQVEVLDWTGEEDLQALKTKVRALSARNPGTFKTEQRSASPISTIGEQFTIIRPGGQREPLLYDPKGYFVISIDPEQGEIVIRHYLPNHTPAHEMRGRGATSMLLGLLRDGLVTQLSHAGYLGEELAKAQTALQFGLRYDQDRPLRPREPTVKSETAATPQQTIEEPSTTAQPPAPTRKMPRINPPMTLEQFETTTPGTMVDVVLAVTSLPRPELLGGTLLEPDEADPFSAFRRTQQRVEVQWGSSVRVAMGTITDFTAGAVLRTIGRFDENRLVHAEQIVVLTRVARVL